MVNKIKTYALAFLLAVGAIASGNLVWCGASEAHACDREDC